MKVAQLTQNEEQQRLWKKFQEGDEAAFSQIYQANIKVMFSYARKISRNEAVIEDCIHDLFLNLWKNRAQLAVPDSVKFYLLASIKRKIYREATSRKDVFVKDFTCLEDSIQEFHYSAESQIIMEQSLGQQKGILSTGFAFLTANQKEAIRLKYYENLSFKEISSVMDLNTDNVYKLVSRGLAVLRKNVQKISFVVALLNI